MGVHPAVIEIQCMHVRLSTHNKSPGNRQGISEIWSGLSTVQTRRLCSLPSQCCLGAVTWYPSCHVVLSRPVVEPTEPVRCLLNMMCIEQRGHFNYVTSVSVPSHQSVDGKLGSLAWPVRLAGLKGPKLVRFHLSPWSWASVWFPFSFSSGGCVYDRVRIFLRCTASMSAMSL